MRLKDDERAFREAVSKGESVEAAVRRLKVPKRMVKYFTRRLPPKQKLEAPPVKPVPVPRPLSSFISRPKQAPEEDDIDGDV